MTNLKESALKLRQGDVKPAAKIIANQHIEKGNFKKTLDLLKHMGKKVKVDKSTEGTSKAIWTIEGTMNEMKLPISDEMFKSLKKGDKIKIGFDSSVKKGNENTYVVKSKSKSAKYNLEKITLKNVANPVAQASYLYNRQGKVTMAQGDMAVTMSTAVKESVNEDNDPCWDTHKKVGTKMKGGKRVNDCVPKSEAILTRAAQRDKDAKKAVKTLKDIRKGKYKGVKMANEEIDLSEGLNPHQIALLKKNYSSIDKIDPSGPAYKKAKGFMKQLQKDELMDLAKAKVKFISQMAADELRKTHKVKMKATEYMESVEESSAAYGKSLDRIRDKKKKAAIKPGELDKLSRLKNMMKNANKESVEESVELDEAIDFRKAHQEIKAYAKKSGGIDKTDFEKVAYYVKAIGDNQNTPNVANKAFMAMKKFVGDMDTDPRDGVMLMLKKHGMMKNGRLVQESVEEAKAPALNPTDYSNGASMSATAWKNNEAIIESIIEEGLSAKQIALLKKNYSTIDRIDPTGPAYKKAKGMISGLDKDMMMDLAKAKVKWLSQMAADELRKKHNIKLKAKDYMESMEEAVSVSRKDFETLKKGDKLSITFDSAVRKGNSAKFLVKGKSHSKKYNVDKITLQNIANPGVQKSFLYSRNGGDATMAQGDMGVTIQKYVKEAVRLEGITDEDVAQFVGAASAAKKAGKKNFTFGGKSYPVTISGDVAKKVLEDSLSEKMDPVDHVEKNKESGMYCVYDANGKKLKEFEDKEAANDYAIKNHKKLMAVTESKYTEVEELIESSDKSDAKEMSNLIKEIQPKISNSELKKEVEQMAMEKYKNKIRAKKIASFA